MFFYFIISYCDLVIYTNITSCSIPRYGVLIGKQRELYALISKKIKEIAQKEKDLRLSSQRTLEDKWKN